MADRAWTGPTRTGGTLVRTSEPTPSTCAIRRDLLSDPAWQRHRHPVARTPWLYHPGTQVFVSYEDAESIEERAAFAAGHGLRGAFTWQLAGDGTEHSLLAAMTRPFRG